MKLFYMILHSFIECNEENMDHSLRGKCKCKKCGREYFKFNTY